MDGYNCGVYVLSAASNFCVKREFIAVEMFKNRRKWLSENFPQACIRALLISTLHETKHFGSSNISDCIVVSYSSDRRRVLRLEIREKVDIT